MEPNWFSAGPTWAGAATWEECSGEQQLAQLAATADVIVVALHLHLGPGWTDQPPLSHIALVQRILDARADVVIAHGSHVPQGILVSNGRVALLSLGNFLFRPDYQMPEQAHDSIMAKVTISPDSLNIALLPLRLDDSGRPKVPPPDEASRILRHLADLSAELGTTIEIHEGIGYITVQRQWINMPMLEALDASPPSVSLAVGETQQLTITATYSDDATADVTGEATYESSDTSVAAVSDTGLITAVAGGSATIAVSYSEQGIIKTIHVPVTVTLADALAYYRSYSGDPLVADLADVVKAGNDWLSGVIPPGFTAVISLTQLVQLANEWLGV